MANMIPISTVTVGSGGAASMAFTNIPSTYTDLQMVFSLRSAGNYAPDSGAVYVQINGDTANQSVRWLYGNGATAGSTTSPAGIFAAIGGGTGATANTFSNGSFYIPNYAGANYKSISIDSVMENNATTGEADLIAKLWSNTAPITSLTFVTNSGVNFAQYSTATLYGIRKY